MITNASVGSLTQGTIFSCAMAEDYDGCIVHGLVITARCDITNDKAEVFNYVPVVRFEDWLFREGVRVIANRSSKSALGDMKGTLHQLSFAPSIMNTTPYREVLNVIFEAGDATKRVRDKRDTFLKHLQRFEAAQPGLAMSPSRESAAAVLANEKVETAKLIRELCHNGVAEAHYIPCVEPGEDCDGYVVLLREIRHIPRALAHAIATGLDQASYAALSAIDARCGGRIQIGGDEFSWPTGMVQSPFIEHLMQRLTLLFSRIGVTDVSDETVRRLQARAPNLSGGE